MKLAVNEIIGRTKCVGIKRITTYTWGSIKKVVEKRIVRRIYVYFYSPRKFAGLIILLFCNKPG